MKDYDYYRGAFADGEFPLAFVDRDALDANVGTVRQRAGRLPVRVASKSVRCRWVLAYVLAHDGFEGVTCYAAGEAAYLADRGFDDLLVAYPVWSRDEIAAACDAIEAGARVTLTVDCPEHVERVASVARERGVEVPLCIDVDTSTEQAGVRVGVRRSPVTGPEEALAVADSAADAPGVHLAGITSYDARTAGQSGHDSASAAVKNAVPRWLTERSRPVLRERRQTVASALEEHGYPLAFVNAGGTGSVESSTTDPWVTEVTVGSGFYAPRLFDHSDDLDPAAGYAIEVTRRPAPDVYTCRGGGYVASGPVGPDRAPAPHLPEGAELLEDAGVGEVQTPVRCDGAFDLKLGDPVVMRHATAGELNRHFTEMAVVAEGEILERAPTYRGDGQCFV